MAEQRTLNRNMDPTKIPATYWAECLEDERRLAPLMGWGRLQMPDQAPANAWIWGSNRSEFKSIIGPDQVSDGIKPVPRWRRDPSAMGQLIECMPANVRWDAGMGLVHVWIDPPDGPALTQAASFKDHPSDGHALRQALVLLAITYLTERQEGSIGMRA
jgi:hypothetical protein